MPKIQSVNPVSNLTSALLALLAGALLTLCQPPWNLFFLAPVALLPLLILALRSGAPARWGWLAGTVHFTSLLGWVYTVMTKYGPLSPVIAVGLTLLLGGVLGLYVALFTGLLGGCARRGGAATALLAAPFLWTAIEVARGELLTGLPWCPLGTALWNHPALARPAAVGGVWLLSFFLAALPAWLWCARSARHRLAWAWPALLVMVWLGITLFERPILPSGMVPHLRVRILQPAIAQTQKWDPAFAAKVLQRLESLATAPPDDPGRPPELILYPESSLPDVEPELLNGMLLRIARKTRARQLLGTEYLMADGKIYNAAVLLGPAPPLSEGELPPPLAPITQLPPGGPPELIDLPVTRFTLPEEDRYGKRHLAPFGEYIPWKNWLHFARKLTHGIGEFTPGESGRPLRIASPGAGPARVGVLICYESIFPDLAANEAAQPGTAALVNISNDAWFDGTGAKSQLLAMSAMRAVESGLPVVRVANTGISGMLYPGHHELLPEDLPLARDFSLPLTARTATVATRLAPLATACWLILGALALIAAARHPRKRY